MRPVVKSGFGTYRFGKSRAHFLANTIGFLKLRKNLVRTRQNCLRKGDEYPKKSVQPSILTSMSERECCTHCVIIEGKNRGVPLAASRPPDRQKWH